MSTRICTRCGARSSPGAFTCPGCGSRQPGSAMKWASAVVAALFTAAVGLGVWQSLVRPDPQPPRALPGELELVERWGLGLHGVGLSVVMPETMVTERGMRRVGDDIRVYTTDRGFVEAYLFTDPDAARLRDEGRADELGVRQDWFDRHLVGVYRRNERIDREELSWSRSGIRTAAPRTIEW